MRHLLNLALLISGVANVALAQPPMEALPAILHLQLSQHPAWRAYKDATSQQAADAAHQASQTVELNAMTTPQRLDALRMQLRSQADAFERQAAATQAFYAVLSPEQRHIFDDVTRLPAPRTGQAPRLRAEGPYPPLLRQPPSGAGLPPPLSPPG